MYDFSSPLCCLMCSILSSRKRSSGFVWRPLLGLIAHRLMHYLLLLCIHFFNDLIAPHVPGTHYKCTMKQTSVQSQYLTLNTTFGVTMKRSPQDDANNGSFTTVQLGLDERLTHCNGSLHNTWHMEISFLFIRLRLPACGGCRWKCNFPPKKNSQDEMRYQPPASWEAVF